jgi:uncharacterized protein
MFPNDANRLKTARRLPQFFRYVTVLLCCNGEGAPLKRLSHFILKYAGRVAILGTLLGILGAYYSVLLYKNLRPDIEELLPSSTRSVVDFGRVSQRLKSVESMVILVFSNHPEDSKRFVDALGRKLAKVPTETISLSVYKIDKELSFFKRREALFLDLPDLIRLKDYIHDRLSYEKKHFFNVFPEADLPPKPTFDFNSLQSSYEERVADYTHFDEGYYATADKKVRAVVTYMPGKGLERAKKMKLTVETAVAELNPRSFAPDLEIKYTGNAANLIEESAALVADLEFSTLVVLVLVTFAMLIFYRSVRATSALLLSLFLGTFWTFGIAFFAVSYLNANTAFLASIVIGNGINSGIIFLARYLEERRRGSDNALALETTMQITAAPTAIAALASGLSYGSLILTGFRGFNQFGIIGLTGMILCWISTYTLLPAFLVVIDRKSRFGWVPTDPHRTGLSHWIANGVNRHSSTFNAFVLGAVVLGFFSLFRYQPGLIETDLSKLKDKTSLEKGAGSLYHYIDDIFGHSFSPLVVMPNTREEARKIASLFRERKEREGKSSVFSTIQTLDDFVPNSQPEKLAVAKSIQAELRNFPIRRLPPRERQLAENFLNASDLTPFTEAQLPAMILDRFTEKDGSRGKLVLVDKVIDTSGKDDADSIGTFVRSVREISDSVSPGAAVAGSQPIVHDMIESIRNDGPKATFFALLAVVILVIVLFRERKTITLALFALGLGVFWLVGIILGFHLKINFLNFIALPITFGIGVDYGVNIFQRYREDGEGCVLDVIRNTGGAVMLCSLTTIIGYGSLLVAGNQAFVSFGRLAVLGELTCITAAIIALPAYLRYRTPEVTEIPPEEPAIEETTSIAA